MATKTHARRLAAATTEAEKADAVKAMLRELAYVLHVTKKISAEIEWPTATPAGRMTRRHADAAPETAAV